MISPLPGCGICLELSRQLDEGLSTCGELLQQFREALAKGDQEEIATLNLKLADATANRSATFANWLDHRKSHGL